MTTLLLGGTIMSNTTYAERAVATKKRIAAIQQKNAKMLEQYARQDKYIEPIAQVLESLVLNAFGRCVSVMNKLSR